MIRFVLIEYKDILDLIEMTGEGKELQSPLQHSD